MANTVIWPALFHRAAIITSMSLLSRTGTGMRTEISSQEQTTRRNTSEITELE